MPELRNYMEDCVTDMLETIVRDMNICKCEQCMYDITAYSLNNLKPKYVVTKKGELYAKLVSLQQQFDVDIISAITTAVAVVSANPRHAEMDSLDAVDFSTLFK